MINKGNDKRSIWILPLLQTIILIAVFVGIYLIKPAGLISNLLSADSDSAEGILIHVIVLLGNGVIATVVTFLLLCCFREKNKERVVNRYSGYHNHLYLSFWYCSKILNYKTCDLRLVPCTMQFKLVIRKTFGNYYYDENLIVKDELPIVNMPKVYTDVINLLISDTYLIRLDEIPNNVSKFSAIIINRTANFDKARYKNDNFINEIISIVRNLPNNVSTINLFSTLNSYSAHEIATKVFDTGGRSNIKHLYIYPQNHLNNDWRYSEKGVKIY